MKIPNGFKLISLKLLTNGGLEVVYEEATKDKSVTNRDNVKRTSPVVPHPDLTKKLEELDDYLADTHNMKAFMTVFKENADFTHKENEAVKNLKRVIDKTYDFLMSQIEMTGFKISGEEASRSITLNGIITHARSTIKLTSPAVKFNGNKYGWEDNLDERIDAISEEVLLYLFDNKAAQGDLFSEGNGKTQLEDDAPKKEDKKSSKKKTAEKVASSDDDDTNFDADPKGEDTKEEPVAEKAAASKTDAVSDDF